MCETSKTSKREIVLFCIIQSLFAVWLCAGFLTDWDSYLYTYAGITFTPVTLASGRWLFAVLLGGIWNVINVFVHIPVMEAWRVFSLTTIIFSMANVVMFYVLACRLANRDVAIVSTSIFVSSPLIAISASAVMTETYALCAFLVCLLILTSNSFKEQISQLKKGSGFDKGLIVRLLLAGIAFGFVCSIREPMIFMIIFPLGIIWAQTKNVKSVLIFLCVIIFVLAVNQAGAYFVCDNRSAIYAQWLEGMRFERLTMSSSLFGLFVRNILFFVCWLVIFSPIIVFTLSGQIRFFFKEIGKRNGAYYWLTPAGIAIAVYTLAEIVNHSLIFNPRFVIFPAVILALLAGITILHKKPAPLKAEYIAGFVILFHAGLIYLSKPIFDKYYFDKAKAAKQIYSQLDCAAEQAVFIPGKFTPLIEFYKKLRHRNWKIVYSGWAFSKENLERALLYAQENRLPIYLVETKYFPDRRYRFEQYKALKKLTSYYKEQSCFVPHFRILAIESGDAKSVNRN